MGITDLKTVQQVKEICHEYIYTTYPDFFLCGGSLFDLHDRNVFFQAVAQSSDENLKSDAKTLRDMEDVFNSETTKDDEVPGLIVELLGATNENENDIKLRDFLQKAVNAPEQEEQTGLLQLVSKITPVHDATQQPQANPGQKTGSARSY